MLPAPLAGPRARAAIIAVMMLGLLAGSLGLAAWVSARRAGGPGDLTQLRLPSLSLRVPPGWREIPSQDLPEEWGGAHALAEPAGGHRLLVVLPLGQLHDQSIPDALAAAITHLMSPQTRASLEGSAHLWQSQWLAGVVYMGSSLADMHKHYLAVLTDRHRLWAIYLTGPIVAPLNNPRLRNLEAAQDRLLFHQILESARPLSPHPGPPPAGTLI